MIGGYVVPRVGMDVVARRNIPTSTVTQITVVQPIAQSLHRLG
jgi:hypothetical protein